MVSTRRGTRRGSVAADQNPNWHVVALRIRISRSAGAMSGRKTPLG